MAKAIVLFVLVALVAVPETALGATYTVGDSSGWTQGVDYSTWTSGKTFTVGDTLVFTYGPSHSVDEVSKSGYDNCNSNNPTKSYSGGSTSITLSSTGPMYFICPTAGHCAGGMKLAINVVAASGGSPPSTASPTPPSTSSPPSTPSSPGSSPPPPPGDNGAISVFSRTVNVILGLTLMLTTVGMWMY